MIRKLITHPNPLLRKRSRAILTWTPAITELCNDMLDTLRANRGVGLAAIQIGVPLRVIVIDYLGSVIKLADPVLESSTGTQVNLEACLSLPGRSEKCRRPREIVMNYLDESGERMHTRITDASLAMVLNHEWDHLNGVIMLDRAFR